MEKKHIFFIWNVIISALLILAFVWMGQDLLEPHRLQEGLRLAAPSAVMIILGLITRVVSYNGGRYTDLVGALTFVILVFVFPLTVGFHTFSDAFGLDPLFGSAIACFLAFIAVTAVNGCLARRQDE